MRNLDILQHYLKNSWRYLLKDKRFTLLNLIGLSTGLACTLLISIWVRNELRFDKFHEKDDQLYEVMIHEKAGNRIATSNGTGDYVGETLLKDLPEVEAAVITTPASWFQKFSLSAGSTTIGASGNFVSHDYFNAFSVPLIHGQTDEVLTNKNSIAISQALAIKLFRKPEHAIGKVLEWKWQAYSGKCLVTGIFADFPANSSQQHDFLLSMDAWNQIVPKGDVQTSSGPFDNFVVLKKGTDINQINKKLSGFAETSFNDSTSTLFLRKYSDAYLFGNYENGIQTGGKITNVRLFSGIAIIILLVACINFMNLSTARASLRVKEVGVKKALGARRATLVFQFLSESMVMSFVALVIAVLLTSALLPQFSAITGKALAFQFDIKMILMILGAALLTGLLAGSYPAFHLSRFNPAITLKGGLTSSVGEILVRKGLVVFQFTVSVVFIIAVMVVYRQIRYVQEKSLGYNKDNIVYFEMNGRVAEQPESFLTQLKSVPGVINASSIQQKIILPAMLPGNGAGVRWEGKNADDKIRFFRMPVNYDLIETMNIEIAEGRSFSKRYGNESASIVLNEASGKFWVQPLGML
ncbi:ABC transporter permease [Dyadobacter sp. CY347]|uniref:ABC transporter permease n=1 Tax=Dyadobacter sp. CY347 TaxID=2909336 RepID=UPI001F233A98|nr:ABC transporter permease [Dyadobacter sp. CY347]MCF2490801.1 ABC transporter permease [Dyadobacter sp. CY347]